MRYIVIFLLTVSVCFGANKITSWADLAAINDALSADYILTTDLDEDSPGYGTYVSLSSTSGKGFSPIGTSRDGFRGTFNGQGHTIADLIIDRSDEDYIGLFGYISYSTVENIGVIKGNSGGSVVGNNKVGGLVGFNESSDISNSYSKCTVSGDDRVGGLVGYNYSASEVSNSYSTGSVSGSTKVGGLVGFNHYASISNSFWDTETSGQDTSSGSGATGLTTSEMQNPFTFYNAGWDFGIWYWNDPMGNRARLTTQFSDKPKDRQWLGQGGYMKLR